MAALLDEAERYMLCAVLSATSSAEQLGRDVGFGVETRTTTGAGTISTDVERFTAEAPNELKYFASWSNADADDDGRGKS